MDLSWPKGHSVNDAVSNNTYLGTSFYLHYPLVDSIIQTLNQFGPGASIFKIDMYLLILGILICSACCIEISCIWI